MEVSKERMIELVENAPDGATHYNLSENRYLAVGFNVNAFVDGWWLALSQSPDSIVGLASVIKLDYLVSEGRSVYTKEMQDRYEIERFVKSCRHAEGDVDETGVVWSLAEVELHIDEYFKPEKTDQEKLIDDLMDIAITAEDQHGDVSLIDAVTAIVKDASINITRKGELNA